jgi:hypothetical protein
MKFIIKPLVALCLMAAAGSSFAVQKDITVTANVDASLDMTQADGSALPKAVEMQYIPGSGLSPYSVQSKIWSNDVSSTSGDIHMKLVSTAQLVNTTGAEGTAVPLTVSWGDDALATDKDVDLAVSDIFPSGDSTTGSVARALTIAQTTKGALDSGNYQGVVSIYLYQDAATQ